MAVLLDQDRLEEIAARWRREFPKSMYDLSRDGKVDCATRDLREHARNLRRQLHQTELDLDYLDGKGQDDGD